MKKKFEDCSHENSVMSESHLAGAAECINCGAYRAAQSLPFKKKKQTLYKYAFRNERARFFQETTFFHPDWYSAIDEIRAHGFLGDNFVYFPIHSSAIEVDCD